VNATEFTELLENTDKVAEKNLDDLKKLAWDYPYSQPIQLLYALRLRQTSEHLFNKQLGKTSILSNNRSVLFELFEMGENIIKAGKSKNDTQAESAEVEEETSLVEEPPVENEEQQLEPLREIKNEEKAEPEEKPSEQKEEVKEETTAEDEQPEEEEEEVDLSQLPMKERIKAILEKNRKLREDNSKAKSGKSPIDQRIEAIKGKVESFKPTPKEEAKEEIPDTEELPAAKSIESQNDVKEAVAEKEEVLQKKDETPATEEVLDKPENNEQHIAEEEPIVFSIEEEKEEIASSEAEEEPVEEEQKETVGSEPEEELQEETLVNNEEEPSDNFDRSSTHSFNDWLKHLKKASEEPSDSAGTSLDVESKIDLFDSFVEKLPKLKKKTVSDTGTVQRIDMSKLEEDSGSLVTETLAKVYLKQRHYGKAVKAYEILKLKYPEKSSFFASQISEIKKLINSN